MLVRILGGIDVVGGAILILKLVSLFPDKVLIFIGMLFLIKASFGMFKDFASWVDGAAGLIFLISALVMFPWLILAVVGVLLIQKGAYSFFVY